MAAAATPGDAPVVPQFSRRDAFMLTTVPDQRTTSRSFLSASFVMTLKDGDPRPHVGLIRDVSDGGMFFYSDINPPCGSDLDFEFKMPQAGMEPVWVACKGRVVRVEQPAPGAAIGVALSIQDRQVLNARHAAENFA